MTKITPKAWVMPCVLIAALLALLLPLGVCAATTNSGRAAAAEEYTLDGATAFTFSDGGITEAEGDYTGYKIEGTALTINDAGTYIVSGSCADGSIKIKKGTTGVTLVLNGLTLTSGDTAPIACNKSTEVKIVAASGTTNTLTDSEQNNDETYTDNTNAENAVIKCKDGSTVTLCGSGTLNVVANGKNGIKSGATTEAEGEASLTIRDLTLNITASVNDAINAEQLLNIESGTLTISAVDDAIHSDLVLNIGADGADGPAINITECYEGIEAATLNVLSGDIKINSTDDCMNAANADLTNYKFSMTISGGTINAYASEGDGFDSNGDLNISGGTVVVWTANRADNQPLDADGTLNVTGGTVLAAGGSNGMGVSTTATQPYVTFGSAGMGGGFHGQQGQRPDSAAAAGTTAVSDTMQRPEKPTGSGGANGAPNGGMVGAASLAKGTAFTILDADGNSVYSGTAVCDANYLFFSSADLTDSGSYTLSADGSEVAAASAQTGTVSGGMGGGQSGSADSQTPPAKPNGSDEMTPPEGAGDGTTPPELPDGQTPPEGAGNGTTPPELPDGQTPPEGAGDGTTPPELPNGEQIGFGKQLPPWMLPQSKNTSDAPASEPAANA